MSARPERRRARPADPTPTTPDLLCYADQASFLALRALGRGPMPHMTWVYDVPVPMEAVERLNARLAAGFLGRRVQRSPLPWGRHRWVAAPAPSVLVLPEAIPPADVERWSAGLVDLPVDPEHGPGWRLTAQPLTDGGLALALTVSHTIADGLGFYQAVVDAVNEVPFAHVYPPPASRRSRILPDLRETVHALPELGRALAYLVRRPPSVGRAGPRPPAPSAPRDPGRGTRRVDLAYVRLTIADPDATAAAARLHGSTNGLVVAFAAQVAARIGRLRPDGLAELVLPISERVPGDLRGNALTAVDLAVDPVACRADLRPLQRDLKVAMVALLREGHPVTRLLPLIPYLPTRLARRLESVTAGSPWAVGCSIYGDMDAALLHPLGHEAADFWVTPMAEAYTEADLELRGGLLFVGGGRVGGRMHIFVAAWQPGQVTTMPELAAAVRAALADLAIPGRLH